MTIKIPTDYLREIGRRGGLKKTKRKKESGAANCKKALAARLEKEKTDLS